MKELGLIVGIIGLPLLLFAPLLGVLCFAIGGLMVAIGSQQQKRELETRRHREMVEAVRKGRE